MHVKKEIWRFNDNNPFCWSFFVVNDNNIIDGKIFHIMCCMFCHIGFVLFSPRTKKGKELYYIILLKNKTTILQKHVDANHLLLANFLKRKWVIQWKVYWKDNLQKNDLMCLVLKYQIFLVQNMFLKKMLWDKNNFFKTNCHFDYQKSLTYLICGKYMVEAFCNALMSKSCV